MVLGEQVMGTMLEVGTIFNTNAHFPEFWASCASYYLCPKKRLIMKIYYVINLLIFVLDYKC
jgi:hypothetical protein